MKSLSLIFFSLFVISCASLKKTSKSNFPEDWIGKYEGQLELWNAEEGNTISLPMSVEISRTDSSNVYKWYSKAIFKGQEIIKDYNIVRNDSMPLNHYLMDENNGIYIDHILLDNSFYDYFEVNGLGLYSITRKVKEGILFEVASFSKKSVSYSTYQGSEFKVDSVASYKVVNTQKVLLKPIKKNSE